MCAVFMFVCVCFGLCKHRHPCAHACGRLRLKSGISHSSGRQVLSIEARARRSGSSFRVCLLYRSDISLPWLGLLATAKHPRHPSVVSGSELLSDPKLYGKHRHHSALLGQASPRCATLGCGVRMVATSSKGTWPT